MKIFLGRNFLWYNLGEFDGESDRAIICFQKMYIFEGVGQVGVEIEKISL